MEQEKSINPSDAHNFKNTLRERNRQQLLLDAQMRERLRLTRAAHKAQLARLGPLFDHLPSTRD